MKPWGLIQDDTYIKVFDRVTDGKSVRQIAGELKLLEATVRSIIRKAEFQADLKLLKDDLEYQELMAPQSRMERLQDVALDVVERVMTTGTEKNRLVAAFDTLDRGHKVPRTQQNISASIVIGAGELSMLAGVLREIGSPLQAQLPTTIDITPEPNGETTNAG